MKKEQALERLQDIVLEDLIQLEKNTILRDGDDYLVFGRYHIRRIKNGYRVVKFSSDIATMTSLRSALSWCIADKYQQHTLAADILRLEAHREMLGADLKTRAHLGAKIRNAEYRENVEMKLATRRQHLEHITGQLDKCVNLAKYWQIRGFNNETARTGRPSSPRTSR